MEVKIIIIVSVVFLLLVVLGLAIVNYSTDEMVEKYKKYSEVTIGTTPQDFANLINSLHFNGRIKIKYDERYFSDCYNSAGVLTLSEKYCGSDNLAGLAICAHELGHAFQFKNQKKRMIKYAKMLKITNFLSNFVSFFVIFGIIALIFNMWLGILSFALGIISITVTIVGKAKTLGVEKDASEKALQLLKDYAYLDDDKLKIAKKFLASAKQTYFAEVLKVLLKWTGLVRRV